MTIAERQEIHARMEEVMTGVEAKAQQAQVNGPPQEEDVFAQELSVSQRIYAALSDLSPQARQRVIQHVVQFFTEQEQRERHEFMNYSEAPPIPMPEEMLREPTLRQETMRQEQWRR